MNDRVMFLLEGQAPFTDWNRIQRGRNLVRVPNFSMLSAALDTGIRDLGIEVTHVILDDAATATEFLGFLCELSPDFRGDVLWIGADGSGFLSGITAADGRVLYRVAPGDVDFYLTASVLDRQASRTFSFLDETTCH